MFGEDIRREVRDAKGASGKAFVPEGEQLGQRAHNAPSEQISGEPVPNPPSMRALVVLSGGLDSTVALAWANDKCFGKDLRAVTFDYGQRHAEAEIQAAKNVAEHYMVPHQVWRVPVFKGESVLMNERAAMPHMTYEELGKAQGPSPTYVPFRNGTFLAIATGMALDLGFNTLIVGTHAEDAANWAYPDCTPEFMGAMQNAIYVGTYHQVRLVAPWTYLSKADIVLEGIRADAPFAMTHSCYEGLRPACGKCPTCVGRLEAFAANSMDDPLEYAFDKYRRDRR